MPVVDQSSPVTDVQQAVPIEQLQKLQDWLREPDHAEHFGTSQILEWINRRPTHILPAVLASLSKFDATQTREAELVAALERAASALGMFVMLIGEQHPGMGARIDAMLDDDAIQEALGAANEARAALNARDAA